MIITKLTAYRILQRFRNEAIAKLASVKPGENYDLASFDGDEILLALDAFQSLVDAAPNMVLLQTSDRG